MKTSTGRMCGDGMGLITNGMPATAGEVATDAEVEIEADALAEVEEVTAPEIEF